MRHRPEDERPRAAAWATRRAAARDTVAPRAAPPKIRRVGFVVVAVAVVAAALSLSGGMGTGPDEATKTLSRAGLPTTPRELVDRITVPDAKNGGPLLTSLGDLTQTFPQVPLLAHAFDGVIAASARDLTRYDDLFLPRDWSRPSELPSFSLAERQGVVRALTSDAVQAAETGDAARLEADLRAADAAASLTAREPTMIAALVSITMSAFVERAAQDAIRANPSPAIRAAVTRYAARRRPPFSLDRSLWGESLFLLDASSSVARFRALTTPSGPDAEMEAQGPTLPLVFPGAKLKAWREEAANVMAEQTRIIRGATEADFADRVRRVITKSHGRRDRLVPRVRGEARLNREREEEPRAAAWAVRRARARPSLEVVRVKRRWPYGVAALLALAALVIQQMTATDPAVDALRAAGMPASFDELAARSAVPKAEDASGLMIPLAGWQGARPNEPILRAPHAAVTTVLVRSLAGFRRLSTPQAGLSGAPMLTELGPWEGAAGVVATDARDAARTGDARRLEADLRGLDALAHLVGQVPANAGMVAAENIAQLTEETARGALRGSPAVRAAVARYANDRRELPDSVRALEGEALLILWNTRDVDSARAAFDKNATRLPLVFPGNTLRAWRAETTGDLGRLRRTLIGARGVSPAELTDRMLGLVVPFQDRSNNPLPRPSSYFDLAVMPVRMATARALTDAALARFAGRPMPPDPWLPEKPIIVERLPGGGFRVTSRGADVRAGTSRGGPPRSDDASAAMLPAWRAAP